jgi:hypothetical protein
MGVQKFEDLIVWQKIQEFIVLNYKKFDSNNDSNEIGKMLNGLIKSINNKLTPSPKI